MKHHIAMLGTIIGGGGGGGGGSIAVPPVALQEAETNQMDVHRNGVVLHGRTAGQVLTLEAPVYLPDGATITGFEVHLTDSDATAASGRNIQTFLMSNTFAAGAGTIVASLATSGAPGRTVLSVTNLNTVVNNTTRHYHGGLQLDDAHRRRGGDRPGGARHARHLHHALGQRQHGRARGRKHMKTSCPIPASVRGRRRCRHLVVAAAALMAALAPASPAGAYCVDYGSGPVVLGTATAPHSANRMARLGHHVYFADNTGGLVVIDVGDPGAPVVVGNLPTAHMTSDVTVAGNRAYLAEGGGGVRIVSLDDPGAPIVLGQLAIAGWTSTVAAVGSIAYAFTVPGGMQIIDAVDPAQPAIVGTFTVPGLGNRMVVAGDLAAIAGSDIHIVSVEDPRAPRLRGHYDTPTAVRGLALAGDLMVVALGPTVCCWSTSPIPPRRRHWPSWPCPARRPASHCPATWPTSPTPTAACRRWTSPTPRNRG